MILSTKQDTRSIQPLSLSKLFSYILRRSGFLPAGFFVFHPSSVSLPDRPAGDSVRLRSLRTLPQSAASSLRDNLHLAGPSLSPWPRVATSPAPWSPRPAPPTAPSLTAFPQCLRRLRHPSASSSVRPSVAVLLARPSACSRSTCFIRQSPIPSPSVPASYFDHLFFYQTLSLAPSTPSDCAR